MAIQLDCFVGPLGGLPRNDILQTRPSNSAQSGPQGRGPSKEKDQKPSSLRFQVSSLLRHLRATLRQAFAL